jgi:hypothetical protein
MKTKGAIDVPADLASALAADAEVMAMWQRLRPSCQSEHVASVLENALSARSDDRGGRSLQHSLRCGASITPRSSKCAASIQKSKTPIGIDRSGFREPMGQASLP